MSTTTASAELLVVAAMHAEIAPLLRRVPEPRPFEHLVTGEGALRMERALRDRVAAAPPKRMLLIGVSGGLSSDLEYGDVVVADKILVDGVATGDPEPQTADTPRATVVASPTILHTRESKQAAYDALPFDGPAVVDLESGAFARLAEECRIPFSVVRAVLDPADETLPLDLERCRAADGRIDRGAIACYALPRPWIWPALLGLARRAARCERALAEFVATRYARF